MEQVKPKCGSADYRIPFAGEENMKKSGLPRINRYPS